MISEQHINFIISALKQFKPS